MKMMEKQGKPARCRVSTQTSEPYDGYVSVSREQVAYVYEEAEMVNGEWKGKNLIAKVYQPLAVKFL
jgi:hypothetical protein